MGLIKDDPVKYGIIALKEVRSLKEKYQLTQRKLSEVKSTVDVYYHLLNAEDSPYLDEEEKERYEMYFNSYKSQQVELEKELKEYEQSCYFELMKELDLLLKSKDDSDFKVNGSWF